MKHFRLNLDLTSVIAILAAGVLLPVMLSTAVGIVSIILAKDSDGIITGVLIISFTATAAGCGLLALVFMGKKARLARQQADFIANVSHELRTPLSAIRLYAQTLESGKLADDPEQTAQCVATILRETTWLNALIDRLLTWRAASKDVLELSLETQPVAEAVYDAIDRFNSMVSPDELTLSVSIETRRCVRHDAKALNSVVLNLLMNAYKYTGIQKQIRVSVQDRDNHVMIEVQDNGIGLTAAEAKHIFQPFYRAVRRDKGETGGVGLGLAIARHLIGQHNGTLSVGSRKDEGSTFTITLPAAENIS
ncbi:Alkaline phosphatase synthesis sensor protein PhoR [Pontiella desulfatans]|uniref:histidine kinase n=1 Tax=Pontiella desulfatans TaxID=2750659 RepID=A0A6C2U9T9_PONDE|nr:HAMP domain-containing sensor histidine kinase [Pontiella desulfatans]VGO16623.1 Alkaline phosphatase synthesis sensor protein PhoR [Pontiella desulfatans]